MGWLFFLFFPYMGCLAVLFSPYVSGVCCGGVEMVCLGVAFLSCHRAVELPAHLGVICIIKPST